MTTRRNGLTRRAAFTRLAGIGGLTAASQAGIVPDIASAAQAQQPFLPHEAKVPVTGKAGPGLETIDEAMLQIMDHHGIPGAAFAIAKDGKLLLAKGYGWANVAYGTPVGPETLFGLASLSKPFTAVAVLKLVEQGKLDLDDKVFSIIKHIKPPSGGQANPGLRDVTVRHCLNHSGGWDRDIHGDAINWEPQICRAMRVPPPLSPAQFVSFALTLKLDFKPGTSAKYSNIGYIALGEVVAKVSGVSYGKFVTEQVLKPMGITRAGLFGLNGKYERGESLRYLAGTLVALPANVMPMLNATGGWSASVVDMARFLTNLDGSRGEAVLNEKSRRLMVEPPPEPLKPRENGTWIGLGWDAAVVKEKAFSYFKDGSYQGMRTYMKRLPNGVNWVLLYNASMEFDAQDEQTATHAVHEVRQMVERIEKHPDVDLFPAYA
jgi:N-acyl-D-amino-acid deacylase